jgi:hypothetical protein
MDVEAPRPQAPSFPSGSLAGSSWQARLPFGALPAAKSSLTTLPKISPLVDKILLSALAISNAMIAAFALFGYTAGLGF